jgi:hypothetical protein
LRLVSSGTGRRRPNIVLTTPLAARRRASVDERAHAREAGEVGVDELLRRLLRHADVLGERERGLPVEQRVVDDLRAAPQLVRIERAVGPNTLSPSDRRMSSPAEGTLRRSSVGSPTSAQGARASSICE